MKCAHGLPTTFPVRNSYTIFRFRTFRPKIEKGSLFFPIFALSAMTTGKQIILSKGTELLRVPASRLMFVSSDGNYSNVVTADGRARLVSFQLGQIEDLIGEQLSDDAELFIRLGRGLIINMDYIYLIDVAKQQLVLSDCAGSWHELSASREALIKLKAYIDALYSMGHEQKNR